MRNILLSVFFLIFLNTSAQGVILSIDSCRALALENNKTLKIYNEKINQSQYNTKSAKANFLPQLDVQGSYIYNSRKLQMMSDKQVETMTNVITGQAEMFGTMVMANPALFSSFEKFMELPALLEEINHINIHNVFTAAATVTQPIYTGGKIAAYYKLCQLSEELNHSELDTKKQDIMMETDKAYWMVVSLVKKRQVAQEYLDLVKLLLYNVNKMLEHGVATLSDQLTVQVKENEANVQLQKVDDGIVLSKMVLAKICGLPLDTDIITEDELERKSDQPYFELRLDSLNMENIFANRDEIKSLSIATEIYKKLVTIERAESLPTLGAVGAYSFMDPNMYNGFQRTFKGMFSVGVALKVPVWSWGKHLNKVNAAKSQVVINELKLKEAKEMITLQVNSAELKLSQEEKSLITAETNIKKANENLRNAQKGFQEGVLTTQNVIEAQTGWLLAKSELVDAIINVQLSYIYYNMAIGKKLY